MLKVFPKEERVVVEGVNMAKRHTAPNVANPQGGVIAKEAPLHLSNVALRDPFQPEAGLITPLLLAQRLAESLPRLVIGLGEGVSTSRGFWQWPIWFLSERAGLYWVPSVPVTIVVVLLGAAVVFGLVVLARRGEGLLVLYVACSLGLIAVLPWPGQISSYGRRSASRGSRASPSSASASCATGTRPPDGSPPGRTSRGRSRCTASQRPRSGSAATAAGSRPRLRRKKMSVQAAQARPAATSPGHSRMLPVFRVYSHSANSVPRARIAIISPASMAARRETKGSAVQ